jgi:hypothetical protein
MPFRYVCQFLLSGPALVINRGIGSSFHVSDHRPATFIHMHMLHSDQLRTRAPEAPQNLGLGCVGAYQASRSGGFRDHISLPSACPGKCCKYGHCRGVSASHLHHESAFNFVLWLRAFDECQTGVYGDFRNPLNGSRAAIGCCSEASTKALEAVPKASFNLCHHSRLFPSGG